MGPVGPLGWPEEAANPSAADEVPPLALRIPPCAWGICSSSCQQHPPPQHQAPHGWSWAWGSAGSRGALPLALGTVSPAAPCRAKHSRPSPCSQNSARMILPFSMPPPGRGKCQPRATKHPKEEANGGRGLRVSSARTQFNTLRKHSGHQPGCPVAQGEGAPGTMQDPLSRTCCCFL